MCVGAHVCMQEESDGARVGLSPGGGSSKYFSAPQAFLSRLCAEDDLSACRTRSRLGPHGLSGPAAHGHLTDSLSSGASWTRNFSRSREQKAKLPTKLCGFQEYKDFLFKLKTIYYIFKSYQKMTNYDYISHCTFTK